ncbi:MAG: hypothetical protein QG553_243 [Patescibacteria group bacterium]|nr:hypothetical protein [Patescibacteria group bacterium]
MGYLLKHERVALHERLAEYEQRQKALALDKEAAVAEGGDGWHDNSAFDAVISDSKQLAERGRHVLRLLEESEDIDYPDPSSRVASVGSRLHIDMFGDLVVLDLVGALEAYREIPEMIDDAEYICTSYKSPLGEAVLGCMPDQQATYSVEDGRSFSVTIIEIDQNAIREAFQS